MNGKKNDSWKMEELSQHKIYFVPPVQSQHIKFY